MSRGSASPHSGSPHGGASRSGALAAAVVLLVATSGCASNVNDLLVEARHGDSESVEEAVVEIGEILYRKERASMPYSRGDDEGLRYLTEVGEKGSDPLNRVRAISSLGRLERPELSEFFVDRLADSFWAVRLEAAKALTVRPYPSAAKRMAEQLAREERPEVRLELVKALGKAGGEVALDTLIDVLLDRSGRYRNMKLPAYDAVCALSRETFDFHDSESWRRYRRERVDARSSTPGDAPAPPRLESREEPSSAGSTEPAGP